MIIKISRQPANLLVAGIPLDLLFFFRTKVYLGYRPHGVGLPDVKVVTHKSISGVWEVVGRMERHCGEYGKDKANLELLRTQPQESLTYIRQPQLQSCDRSSSHALN